MALDVHADHPYRVEGTGSYGAYVAAILGEHGFDVVEVNRPNRQVRRFRGKADADAEAAARSALSESASAIPKSHDGLVESIMLLRGSLTRLRKCRTALTNTLRNVIIGAPPFVQEQLASMTDTALVTHCSRLQVAAGAPTDPVQALRSTLRALATHILAQTAELNGLRVHLTELTRAANPATLLAAPGVGVDRASALLVATGDNRRKITQRSCFRCAVRCLTDRGVFR